MGQFYNELPDDPKLIDWIKEQQLFHVATAPLNGGHVNISPKGLPSFKLVSRKACWYLDLAGSGNETISHLYEPGNGRITLLFEAFQGPPRILRFYGKGKVFERGTAEFDRFFDWHATSAGAGAAADELDFPTPELLPGARSVIWIDITHVGTSCGFSVPLMSFEAHRKVHTQLSEKMERTDAEADDPYALSPDDSLKAYTVAWNTWSIDGLPGVRAVADRAKEENVAKMMVEHGLTPPAPQHRKGSLDGTLYKATSALGRLRGGGEQWVVVLAVGVMLGAVLTVFMQSLNSDFVYRFSALTSSGS